LDSEPTPFPDLGVTHEAAQEATEVAIPPAQEIAPPPPEPDKPWIENPAWRGLDLLILACVMFFGLVLFTGVGMGVLHSMPQYSHKPIQEIARNPSVWIIIPAMGAAYAVTFAMLYLIAAVRKVRFWSALSWRWPGGLRWMGFLLAGIPLAIVAGLLDKILPMPKSPPIEELLLQPGAPQLLAFFGVAIAPFVEETLFRGLLYPVSNRWLRSVLNSQQSIRRGRLIFLLLVPWGFLAHSLSSTGNLLLLAAVLVFTATLFAIRSLPGSSAEAARVILPGLTFFAWGAVASHLSRGFLERASLVLLFLVFLMTVLGLQLKPGSAATRIGVTLSFLLTAVSFALLHSEQLGNSWAPVLVLFLVSCALTLTRAYTKSLASSFLVHVGYNGALFGAMFLATDHFRPLVHLSR